MKKILLGLSLLLSPLSSLAAGVINGQPVNAAITNAAFLYKNGDDTQPFTITWNKENILKFITTPTAPSVGYMKIYVKNDNNLYIQDSSSNEIKVSNAAITQLTGDVLAGPGFGSQVATVAYVSGQSAASVANATVIVFNATSASTGSRLVLRDSTGNFAASNITATLIGNASTATTAISFTGPLLGDVTGTQGATVVSLVGGKSSGAVATSVTATQAATSSNTPNTIVLRGPSGEFSAGLITANLSGNASTATTSGSTTNAINGLTASTSTNAVFYPLFASTATNSYQPFNLSTGLSYNPSTSTVTAVTFSGNLTGNASGTAANVTGIVSVANGGTGSTALALNNVLLGNGTSAIKVVAPGSTGNVLTSDGTIWISAAASTGSSGQASIQFQDQGSNLGTSGTATTVNCTGSALTCSRSTNTITINVSTGSTAAPTYTNSQTFTATGLSSFTVPAGVYELGVVLVAGGGGGSSGATVAGECGGGGGGGSVSFDPSYKVTPGEIIKVYVGSGGTGSDPTGPTTALAGNVSYFGTLAAMGGSPGAGDVGAGNPRGNGGGKSPSSGTDSGQPTIYLTQSSNLSTTASTFASSTGYFRGGNSAGTLDTNGVCGGGAGNQSDGSAATVGVKGGNGGTGFCIDYSGSSVCYGGGGGGGTFSSGGGIVGGTGANGGGNGGANAAGTAGTANTGGGGGGSGPNNNGAPGGSGFAGLYWN